MKVKVVHVVKDWDMRVRHRLRDGRRGSSLKRGQCLVAFNRAKNMARIIDAVGAVHDYYADKGEEYDLDLLAKHLKAGLFVDLQVGRHEAVKGVVRLRRAA